MKELLLTLATAVLSAAAALAAPMGTAFTYHGRLHDHSGPANGNYDFKFLLYDDPVAGNPVANYLLLPTTVSNGLFVVELDFGAAAFDGSARWLDIGVRPSNVFADFTALTPRQSITPAPYALYARNAASVPTNSITSEMLMPGAVNSAALADLVELGQTNLNGQLLVYRTAANTPGVGLYGSSSSIVTYGLDGLEQTKLWGALYGELLLHNSLGNNATAVQLTANSADGGALSLNSSNGTPHAYLSGDNAGGRLWLYQPNGAVGVYADANEDGAGYVGLSKTNGGTGVYLSGIDDGTIYSGNAIRAVNLVEVGSHLGGALKLVKHIGGPTYAALEKNGVNGGAFRTYDSSGNPTAVLSTYTPAGGAYMNVNMIGSALPGVSIAGDDGNSGAIYVKGSNDVLRVRIDGDNGNGPQITMFNTDGVKTVDLAASENSTSGSRLVLYQKNGVRTIEVDSEVGVNGGGYLGINQPDGTAGIQMWAKYTDNKARLLTPVLQITGGSDLSEQFDIAGKESAPQPGMVLCIDPENAGKLRISERAFDRTVAGVISGAGGIAPGMMMGQSGTLADGQYPVALTGRVYVRSDADAAPIEPGDLLTTSDTAGHAMKATDSAKAQGAILGKAMTRLAEGKGLVLVLVTLQ